ncbi:PREDICTED: transcription factor bHLH113-like isoform X2 [Camelina sativa]|uniref:Transcription factor bHLH113-like isoform X2 n=1 Tax=Camelina sativa TaxID=90675 RepID=A0ABM0W5U0_CAMSA|nr:PREDICTED: transcription factor bHLH113-like isoform X2 [Camelina sativa]
MGDNTAEDHDDLAMVEAEGVTSFSELLMFSDGVLSSSDHQHESSSGGDGGGEDSLGFVFSGKTGSRMLCFSGDYQNDDASLFLEPSSLPSSGVSVLDPSCIKIDDCKNFKDACTVDKSTKPSNKRTGTGNEHEPDQNRKPGKKCKRNQDKSSVGVGTVKVRKERLGERIAALQQLVSPYGKTDAASVLHEAMGYIKFLQDQIQVLCSPYLINHTLVDGGVVTGDVMAAMKAKDLRSRGLCLVPVSSTVHVENSNGADFWSPATMGHTTTTSPSTLHHQGF